MLKTSVLPSVLPSFLLVIMGSIDCLTTVIGVMYFGAAELNPFLAGIVSTNIQAFFVIKMAATLFIGLAYSQAKKALMSAGNQNSKSVRYTSTLLKVAYAGIVIFLIVVVANNFVVLATT